MIENKFNLLFYAIILPFVHVPNNNTMLKIFVATFAVLSVATSVRGYGLTCPNEFPATVTLITSNITDADGVITLDNLDFTPGASVWLSENNVPLTIESGAMNITLNGSGCRVGDDKYYESLSSHWDGAQFWNSLSTKPGFYIQGQGLDFICTLAFNPPISKFSAYVNSFEGTTGAMFIYDKAGNQIDCSYNVPQVNNGMNSFDIRGFESDTPIHTLSFSYGYMTTDLIQYKRFCSSGYNPYFDDCSGRK